MFWKSLLLFSLLFSTPVFSADPVAADEESGIEELDPFAPGVEDFLKRLDEEYEEETGLLAFPSATAAIATSSVGCYQSTCALFVDIDKSTQTLSLYLYGRFENRWLVSTGSPGRGTPNYNKRFDGRIYRGYMSSKYPGGDYRGLGNMPYAMFISGGIALHGTPEGNWSRLGRPASHGCIRMHPGPAAYINSVLRQVGVANSWVRVR